MENKEYKLGHFKAGDFRDPNGNTWAEASFEGVSEPVKWVVKDPSKITVGENYYGHFTDETTKTGKPYRRFRRVSRPEGAQDTQSHEQSDKPTPEYWDDRQAQIRAQWAINQSREYMQHILGTEAKLIEICDTAKLFYAMVDRVKGSTPETSDTIQLKGSDNPASGYETAKKIAASLKSEQVPVEVYDDPKYAPDPDDADIVTGGPIDLDSIPF